MQSQMGASLAALGKALSLLVNLPQPKDKLDIIEALSDGARLLADTHHEQSVSRQNVIATNLDKNIKTVTESIELDGWLFGVNLHERMKNAKQIEKSGEVLKPKPVLTRKFSTKNFRNPPRQQSLGGPQAYKKRAIARSYQPRRDQNHH